MSALQQQPRSLSPVPRNSKPKPCLSPIVRPKSSLKMSSLMKAAASTGSLKRNKISFGDTNTLVFEKDISDHDEQHKNQVWFSNKEMKSIRKDLKKSIKAGDITRGLEGYEGDMGASTKQKRLDHMYRILDLQDEQRERGHLDGDSFDKSLQMLSRAMSFEDIHRARKLASADSTQALVEYQEAADSAVMTRTSSRNALDKFRKTVSMSNAKILSLDAAVASALGGGGGGGGNAAGGQANATFGTAKSNATFGSSSKSSKKGPKPNMLLQAIANKKQGQAGVA